jgi:LysM repeat protein
VYVLDPTPAPQVVESEETTEAETEAAPAATEPPQETEAESQPAPVVTSIDPVIFIDYRVQPGDTLYRISSNRIDTSISLMARYNISAEDLVVDRVIRLPIGNPDYCINRRPYAVREGDTAFSVARRFNISLDDLRAVNNLDANATIYVATIICLP